MNPKNHKVQVLSVKNQCKVADQCYVAESFFDRMKGLIGQRELHPGSGLILRPCNDIHMWFMSVPIDVVFLREKKGKNGAFEVTSVHRSLKPWKIFPVRDGRAALTLELPVGTADRCDIRSGDELCIN